MYFQLVDNQVLSTPRVNLMCSTCTAFVTEGHRHDGGLAVRRRVRDNPVEPGADRVGVADAVAAED